jgi:hypothetical protein
LAKNLPRGGGGGGLQGRKKERKGKHKYLFPYVPEFAAGSLLKELWVYHYYQ